MSKQNISNTILANPNLIIGIPPKSLNQGRTLMTRILGLIQTLFAQKGCHISNQSLGNIKGGLGAENTRLRLAESEILGRINL